MRSSLCPRSHDSSGPMGSRHRAQCASPRLTLGAHALRCRSWACPYPRAAVLPALGMGGHLAWAEAGRAGGCVRPPALPVPVPPGTAKPPPRGQRGLRVLWVRGTDRHSDEIMDAGGRRVNPTRRRSRPPALLVPGPVGVRQGEQRDHGPDVPPRHASVLLTRFHLPQQPPLGDFDVDGVAPGWGREGCRAAPARAGAGGASPLRRRAIRMRGRCDRRTTAGRERFRHCRRQG